MSKIILLLFFSSIGLYSASPEWKFLKERETYRQFYGIKCVDSLNCVTYGSIWGRWGKFVLNTTNGGKDWKEVYIDSSGTNMVEPRGFAYPDPNLIIIVGDSGYVLRSTNQGESWNVSRFDTNRTLFNLRMLNKNYGIMCAGHYSYSNPGGYLYYTNNGGLDWIKMNTPEDYWNLRYEDIYVVNENLFIALIINKDTIPEILFVNKNWESWHTYPRDADTRYLYFVNDKVGWICGGRMLGPGFSSQLIMKTEDGGKSWITQRDTGMEGYSARHIDFFDEKHGMITSGRGVMLVTNNGGNTWRADTVYDFKSGDPAVLHDVAFPSITTAYTNYMGFRLLKYTRDWTLDAAEEQNGDYNFQVYPNPAQDFVDFSFTKEIGGVSEVSIVDVNGGRIKTFATDKFSTRIDVSDLPTGVYQLIVNFGKQRLIKPFTILR